MTWSNPATLLVVWRLEAGVKKTADIFAVVFSEREGDSLMLSLGVTQVWPKNSHGSLLTKRE
jgi:hypothetical protein